MKKSIVLMMTAFMFCAADSYAAQMEQESTALVPVSSGELEEMPCLFDDEEYKSPINLHELFNDCYRGNNASACQQLLALASYATRAERAALHKIIADQQGTLATHERTINSFNKMHEKKSARRCAKRGAPRGQGYGMTCGPKPGEKPLSDNS
jgi:hypothetical protein